MAIVKVPRKTAEGVLVMHYHSKDWRVDGAVGGAQQVRLSNELTDALVNTEVEPQHAQQQGSPDQQSRPADALTCYR